MAATRAVFLMFVVWLNACASAADSSLRDAGGGDARPAGGSGGSGGAGTGGSGGSTGSGGHGAHHLDAAEAPGEEPDAAAVPPPTPQAIAIAGGLHGAFLRLDCASEEFEFQFCFPEMKGMKRVPLRLGGEAGKRYAVSLRVWGVMEAITYRDGMQSGKHFYIGGRVGTPMTAEYALEVQGAAPAKYHFNHMDIGAGDHYTYGFTYVTPAIILPGAASLVLYVSDPDNYINTNHMQSEVEDVTPGLQEKLDVIKAQPLQGQFIYLEVATAVAVP